MGTTVGTTAQTTVESEQEMWLVTVWETKEESWLVRVKESVSTVERESTTRTSQSRPLALRAGKVVN